MGYFLPFKGRTEVGMGFYDVPVNNSCKEENHGSEQD
jgi:hypothetical protein